MAEGHSVLLVAVPALEQVVRPPLQRWAPDYLQPDPEAVHAHVTLLAPFLAEPLAAVPALRALFATVAPFEVSFGSLGRFSGDGLVYAVPEPAAPWRALTERLVGRWPQCPPYGGGITDVVPHLSIDHADRITDLAPLVTPYLPVTMTVREAQLVWYEPHRSHVMARFPLGR